MSRQVAGVLALLVLAGCGGLNPPSFRLTGVEFGDEPVVTVMLGNRNCHALRVSDVVYRVEVGPVTVASGERRGVLLLPGRDSVEAGFPVTVEWANALPALSELLADTVALRVSGSYSRATMFGRRRSQFVSEHRVSVRGEAGRMLERLFTPSGN